ncbi:MAG: HD domain-containing protein, partial [Thermoleophilia bacterium]|nr:HD domain-containing protein [Thermoleophilia bacterium]
LKLAALMHDLGKPATHHIDQITRRVSFVGHDSVGVPIVDAICDRWAMSNALRSQLKHLVNTHLELGWLLHRPLDSRALWRFLRKVEPVAPEAIALSVADRLGTAGVDDRRSWVRRHVEVAHATWAAAWHGRAHGVAEPLLNGTEIAAACEVELGPQIGVLVRALAEAQATGEVTNRKEAESCVQQYDVSAEH